MTFYNRDILASQQALTTFPDNPISISSFKVNPIAQYALPHVDSALLFARPEGTLSSDNQQFLSPLPPVVEPPPTVPAKAQAARPSNAFMLFRSEFVKQHVGRRQQELSIMAACAWRALGTDGQTGWYEKAALAKGQYDGTSTGLKATRQRPKPYRSRVNARDVVHMDSMRPVRETFATLSSAPSARHKMRKSVYEPISSSALCVQDPVPIVRSSALISSSALGHALHPPSFFAGLHNQPEEANTSPTSSIQSVNSESFGGSDVHTGRLNYVVSAPIYPAASAAPLSPYDSFVAGFPSPSPIQYPSPVSLSDWDNGFIELDYNLPSALSAAGGHVGLYDENCSQQDPFRRHAHFL